MVLSRAKSSFGKKAAPLLNFMSLEAYYEIVRSCAVLLMNHTRQQAFNTIMMAIAAGCKVFLREENTILACLKREGFKVYSIQKDFQKTTALNPLHQYEQQHNLALIHKLYSYGAVRDRIQKEIEAILIE